MQFHSFLRGRNLLLLFGSQLSLAKNPYPRLPGPPRNSTTDIGGGTGFPAASSTDLAGSAQNSDAGIDGADRLAAVSSTELTGPPPGSTVGIVTASRPTGASSSDVCSDFTTTSTRYAPFGTSGGNGNGAVTVTTTIRTSVPFNGVLTSTILTTEAVANEEALVEEFTSTVNVETTTTTTVGASTSTNYEPPSPDKKKHKRSALANATSPASSPSIPFTSDGKVCVVTTRTVARVGDQICTPTTIYTTISATSGQATARESTTTVTRTSNTNTASSVTENPTSTQYVTSTVVNRASTTITVTSTSTVVETSTPDPIVAVDRNFTIQVSSRTCQPPTCGLGGGYAFPQDVTTTTFTAEKVIQFAFQGRRLVVSNGLLQGHIGWTADSSSVQHLQFVIPDFAQDHADGMLSCRVSPPEASSALLDVICEDSNSETLGWYVCGSDPALQVGYADLQTPCIELDMQVQRPVGAVDEDPTGGNSNGTDPSTPDNGTPSDNGNGTDPGNPSDSCIPDTSGETSPTDAGAVSDWGSNLPSFSLQVDHASCLKSCCPHQDDYITAGQGDPPLATIWTAGNKTPFVTDDGWLKLDDSSESGNWAFLSQDLSVQPLQFGYPIDDDVVWVVCGENTVGANRTLECRVDDGADTPLSFFYDDGQALLMGRSDADTPSTKIQLDIVDPPSSSDNGSTDPKIPPDNTSGTDPCTDPTEAGCPDYVAENFETDLGPFSLQINVDACHLPGCDYGGFYVNVPDRTHNILTESKTGTFVLDYGYFRLPGSGNYTWGMVADNSTVQDLTFMIDDGSDGETTLWLECRTISVGATISLDCQAGWDQVPTRWHVAPVPMQFLLCNGKDVLQMFPKHGYAIPSGCNTVQVDVVEPPPVGTSNDCTADSTAPGCPDYKAEDWEKELNSFSLQVHADSCVHPACNYPEYYLNSPDNNHNTLTATKVGIFSLDYGYLRVQDTSSYAFLLDNSTVQDLTFSPNYDGEIWIICRELQVGSATTLDCQAGYDQEASSWAPVSIAMHFVLCLERNVLSVVPKTQVLDKDCDVVQMDVVDPPSADPLPETPSGNENPCTADPTEAGCPSYNYEDWSKSAGPFSLQINGDSCQNPACACPEYFVTVADRKHNYLTATKVESLFLFNGYLKLDGSDNMFATETDDSTVQDLAFMSSEISTDLWVSCRVLVVATIPTLDCQVGTEQVPANWPPQPVPMNFVTCSGTNVLSLVPKHGDLPSTCDVVQVDIVDAPVGSD